MLICFLASSFIWLSAAEQLFLSLGGPLKEWGATDLPAQGGGMMSGGGSSLNGILETEKVKRERFVNTVTIHRPDYKETETTAER